MSNKINFGVPKNAAKRSRVRFGVLAVATVVAASTALTACGTSAQHTEKVTPTQATDQAAASVTVTDAWAKAATMTAEHPMTGVFMIVENATDHDVTVMRAESDAAKMVQLHETVADESGATTMQEVKDGFVVPAGSKRVLEPGGDHVMLMGLNQDLIAGDTTHVTLVLSDGTSIKVDPTIRDYSGAKEEYSHEETTESSEHEMSEMTHSDEAESHDH
ncbi:copper chaperone PCu(A)C [Timonella sp. A28]|uniref:copper chaperone PCu(A)C n=1 Tax=Timonella sp. A28 TaxID=3442640 RepID=UPI003EBFD700